MHLHKARVVHDIVASALEAETADDALALRDAIRGAEAGLAEALATLDLEACSTAGHVFGLLEAAMRALARSRSGPPREALAEARGLLGPLAALASRPLASRSRQSVSPSPSPSPEGALLRALVPNGSGGRYRAAS